MADGFPFVGYDIERYGDTAMVSVMLIHAPEPGASERIAYYETLSDGATKSARNECIKHAQTLNVRWMA